MGAGRQGSLSPPGPWFHDQFVVHGARLCLGITSLSPCSPLAGPHCPGAAMPRPSSLLRRRTHPWGRSLSTRWTPVASSTSTRRSSACFPRFGSGRQQVEGLTQCGLCEQQGSGPITLPSTHSNPGPSNCSVGFLGSSLRFSGTSRILSGYPLGSFL